MLDVIVETFNLINYAANTPDHLRRLVGSASLIVGGTFVIHGIKLIRLDGRLIVSFPDRIETCRCPWCGDKTPLTSRFCQGCGTRRPEPTGESGPRVHHDICHPTDGPTRTEITRLVIEAWERAVEEKEGAESLTPSVNGRPPFNGPLNGHVRHSYADSCAGKTAHPTKDLALAHIAGLKASGRGVNVDSLVAYRCEHGDKDHWHIGHRSGAGRKVAAGGGAG